MPGSELEQGQQFFAEIQVSRRQKGNPKAALTKAPRMLHGSNFADFSTGDISRCLRVTVSPSLDKKLLEHIIEVKVIHDPKGKYPVVLTAKKITLADGKTGTVSVVEADGSEIEVEATMKKFRTGGYNTSSPFVPTADEAKAIAEIKKLGGEVGDDQMPSGEPGITVILEGTKSTDEGLAHIARLTRLLVLSLDGSQVTDAGLAHLAGLTELWSLSLGDTQVTDAGLVHLVGLKKLRGLSLTGTQVTDAGLKQIAGLTQLEGLWLDDTKVTDAGVKKLSKALPKCEIVWP